MPTRIIFTGLQFFGVAAAVSIAVALLAPIDAMRFLGVVALACAGTGFLLQIYALRRVDPHAFMVMRFHARAATQRAMAACMRVAEIFGHVSRPTPSGRARATKLGS